MSETDFRKRVEQWFAARGWHRRIRFVRATLDEEPSALRVGLCYEGAALRVLAVNRSAAEACAALEKSDGELPCSLLVARAIVGCLCRPATSTPVWRKARSI